MNRSIVYIGVGFILLGFALIASPIVLTGAEQFTLEQELGLFVVPFGLVVILLGAVAHDPETTTVSGAFGSSEANVLRAVATARSREAPRPPVRYNPKEPVGCRYCRTNIPAELVQCPRCTRARSCRGCGRPLGMVLDRPTCPTCARAEAFCNCPMIARAAAATASSARGARRV